MLSDNDIPFIERAIELSKNCKSEPGKVSPKVGAVVVKDGIVVAESFRGQTGPGDHAEFIAIHQIAGGQSLEGATVYTTLEPCVLRNPPKEPCADRLIARGIKRVIIGMVDPNPSICGKGIRKLNSSGVAVQMFPKKHMDMVEECNREFTEHIETQVERLRIDPEFISTYKSRDIDDWYNSINYIYSNNNFYRDVSSIFTHLVESVGGLTQIATRVKSYEKEPERYVNKAIAWWLALCGKVGVVSVKNLLWLKFPGVCPYCQREVHDQDLCKEIKTKTLAPNWITLKEIADASKPPERLGDWQRMFKKIYPLGAKPEFREPFARLSEELGELAESIRVFSVAPGYFLSEAADVFAWLMNIQNNIDLRDEKAEVEYGLSIEELFCKSYPDFCTECKKQECICPPLPKATIGRLGHEMPVDRELFDISKAFLMPQRKPDFGPPV
jgi:pyrimidine deaminase RibD-like protein/NTP pyrophosphatase (non-canonical NTP hydrolase)